MGAGTIQGISQEVVRYFSEHQRELSEEGALFLSLTIHHLIAFIDKYNVASNKLIKYHTTGNNLDSKYKIYHLNVIHPYHIL